MIDTYIEVDSVPHPTVTNDVDYRCAYLIPECHGYSNEWERAIRAEIERLRALMGEP